MKARLIIIATAVLALASCIDDRNAQLLFKTDLETIIPEAAGGSYKLELSSSDTWTATANRPWIAVSPANGVGSATCEVIVDSTLVSEDREGIVRFRNSATSETRDVAIRQKGFSYCITLDTDRVSIPDYANVDDREFTVRISTNVPFEVKAQSGTSSWLSCEKVNVRLDRGARPRDLDLKFKWGVNSRPDERVAEVRLVSTDPARPAQDAILKVVQGAAELIEPSRRGDSLAVLALNRNLGLWSQPLTADKMDNWDDVELWEETDKGYTPAKKGRVRKASFFLFQTTEEIPYEVRYLTEAEELSFFSNVNFFLYDLSCGEYITELVNLKRLTISAYGLSTLPDSFSNLSKLEYLDLSSNNFARIPAVLKKENFPNLHSLFLNTCQRSYILDLSNSISDNIGGFHGKFPRELLEWENLDTLRLSVNYLEGSIPDMKDYPVRYTEEDAQEMNLPPALVGTPKVLPKAKFFAVNLNRLSGDIPDWILYHPNLVDWNPYLLVYNQEGKAKDGRIAGFDNIPVNMEYYWDFYKGYKDHVDIYLGD